MYICLHNGRVKSNVNEQYNSNWAFGNNEILIREQLTKNTGTENQNIRVILFV